MSEELKALEQEIFELKEDLISRFKIFFNMPDFLFHNSTSISALKQLLEAIDPLGNVEERIAEVEKSERLKKQISEKLIKLKKLEDKIAAVVKTHLKKEDSNE